MRNQPRTAAAFDDFVLQNPQGVRIQTMHLPFRVDGRKAPVTGGASGIGQATCRALHIAGAQVVIADIDQPGAEALARDLSGAAVRILDISDESSFDVLPDTSGIFALEDLMRTLTIAPPFAALLAS